MVAAMKPAPSAGKAGGGNGYYVIVNDAEVRQVVGRLELSLSGYALFEFLRSDVSDFFAEDIESRFNEEGDVKSGFWQPLSEGTVRIREALGYPGDGPINHRTGDLEAFVTDERDFLMGNAYARMDVPGKAPTTVLETKLRHAQQGAPASENPLASGSTPPRPVLAVSEMDLGKLLKMLQVNIIRFVNGGSDFNVI